MMMLLLVLLMNIPFGWKDEKKKIEIYYFTLESSTLQQNPTGVHRLTTYNERHTQNSQFLSLRTSKHSNPAFVHMK